LRRSDFRCRAKGCCIADTLQRDWEDGGESVDEVSATTTVKTVCPTAWTHASSLRYCKAAWPLRENIVAARLGAADRIIPLCDEEAGGWGCRLQPTGPSCASPRRRLPRAWGCDRASRLYNSKPGRSASPVETAAKNRRALRPEERGLRGEEEKRSSERGEEERGLRRGQKPPRSAST